MLLRGCVIALLWLPLVVSLPAAAEVLPFSEGRLSLVFGPLFSVELPASGQPGVAGTAEGVRTPSGAISQLVLPASLFTTSGFRTTSAEPAPLFPIRGFELSFANDAGSFAASGTGTSASFAGVMALRGVLRYCVFAPCADPSVSLGTLSLDPVGAGGTATESFLPSATLVGAPWDTAPVTLDLGGGATSQVGGSVATTVSGGTALRLVTPILLSTNVVGVGGSPLAPTRGLGLLELVIAAPEPRLAALLAVASAALGAVGWWRRRSAR